MENENKEHVAYFDGMVICQHQESDLTFGATAWRIIGQLLDEADILQDHDIEIDYADGRKECFVAIYDAEEEDWDLE